MIIFCIIAIHILCGISCYHLTGFSSYFTIIDFLLLCVLGPIIVLMWVLGEIYYWVISQLNRKKKIWK
jgi:nucleoside recognition membrane protein YjiH